MSLINPSFHGVAPFSHNFEVGEPNDCLEPEFFEAGLDMGFDLPQVALTADRGHASNFETVLPVLLRRRYDCAA